MPRHKGSQGGRGGKSERDGCRAPKGVRIDPQEWRLAGGGLRGRYSPAHAQGSGDRAPTTLLSPADGPDIARVQT